MEAILRRPFLSFSLFVFFAMLSNCLLYFPSINAYFVLDDFIWLEKVPVDRLISYFYGPWGHAMAYRPLMRVSFLSDYLMFGDHPLGWHLHSYLIHACNAAFLFLVIRLLTGQRRIAGLVSLFFMLSPLGYENVVWISARVNALGSFFYLSGLYFYLRYMLPDINFDDSESNNVKESAGDENNSSRLMLAVSFILFSLGLLSYEAVVSFPVLLCLLFITHGRPFLYAIAIRL